MSTYSALTQHLIGKSKEQITEAWQPAQAERFDEVIASQRSDLANAILRGIIKRAEEGHLDAVTWLESRGLVDLPDYSSGDQS